MQMLMLMLICDLFETSLLEQMVGLTPSFKVLSMAITQCSKSLSFRLFPQIFK